MHIIVKTCYYGNRLNFGYFLFSHLQCNKTGLRLGFRRAGVCQHFYFILYSMQVMLLTIESYKWGEVANLKLL
jgi:hypothetical protein